MKSLSISLVFLACPAFLSPPEARAGAVEYVVNDVTSPVTTDALTPFLVGTGLTLALIASKSEISHPVQETITRNRPLDRWARFGDWSGKMYPNMIYTGGALLSAAFGHERGLVRAEEMALASIYSGLVSNLLKVIVREGRPNNGADKKSFPSGHATTAFAFAGIVGAEHPIYIAIPAYIIAVNTAYSRMNDNKHYLHDVVGGATIGLSYALGVYYNRQKRDEARAQGRSAATVPMFALMPNPELDGGVFGAVVPF